MKIGRILGALALWVSATLAACDAGVDSSGLASGDVARGMKAVEVGQCRSCHGDDLAGSTDVIPDSMVYSSNITPDDETGIGLWSDEDLDAVLRRGKDDSGLAVCAPMPVYDTMTEQESADIIAYLRSVPPVNRQVTESECR